jgi:transcriptional regulator with XRE-family HTH domain
MPTKPTSFAARLTRLREAAGISKYRLGKLSGLTTQAIYNLELGHREPNWVTVQRIARSLGVSCEEFTDPDLELPPVAPPARTGQKREEPPVKRKKK